MQELHEPSNAKALAKASTTAESSQEIPPPTESVSKSPEVIEIHSNWCTPFMIYLRTGACRKIKTNTNDYVIGQDTIP
jgi:hypothetical protein